MLEWDENLIKFVSKMHIMTVITTKAQFIVLQARQPEYPSKVIRDGLSPPKYANTLFQIEEKMNIHMNKSDVQ